MKGDSYARALKVQYLMPLVGSEETSFTVKAHDGKKTKHFAFRYEEASAAFVAHAPQGVLKIGYETEDGLRPYTLREVKMPTFKALRTPLLYDRCGVFSRRMVLNGAIRTVHLPPNCAVLQYKNRREEDMNLTHIKTLPLHPKMAKVPPPLPPFPHSPGRHVCMYILVDVYLDV